jgi:hypothetical protein
LNVVGYVPRNTLIAWPLEKVSTFPNVIDPPQLGSVMLKVTAKKPPAFADGNTR